MTKTRYFSRLLDIGALWLLIVGLAIPSLAHANICWSVTGWTSTSFVGANAILVPEKCQTPGVSPGGWTNIFLKYGTPPNPADGPLWLLIPSNDPHLVSPLVSPLVFKPLLVFAGYDIQNKPIVTTDLITGPNDFTQLSLVSPEQGVAACVEPPNTTMVAWYPFDTATGTTTADLASGNTGTIFNGVVGAGMVASALVFNGFSTYVEAPSTMNNNFGPANMSLPCSIPVGGGYSSCLGDFSIDAWVNLPTNTPSNTVKIIVDKRRERPLQGYSFFLGSNGRLGLQLASGNSFSNYSSGPTAGVPSDGNWHHVAVTVDRRIGALTSGIITWYIDGVLAPAPSSVATNVLGSLVNNSPLRIGTRTAAFPLSGWFYGAIDELEILNRTLTSREIRNIYLARTLGKCKPPPSCGGNPSTC